MNKLPRSWLVRVTTTKQLNWVFWNAARCAIIHPLVGTQDCLVTRNYTQSRCVVSFSFSVKAVAHWFGGSLLFFPRHVQYSWGQCSPCHSRNEVWFITEDVSIIDQNKGGRVGTNLFGLEAGLDGYVLLNRVWRFSRRWVLNNEVIQFHEMNQGHEFKLDLLLWTRKRNEWFLS